MRKSRMVECGAVVVSILAMSGPVSAQQVVINEIMYNPLGTDAVVLLEYIELYNADIAAVDLSGWELDFGPEPLVFPPGTSVAAGGYVLVAENATRLFNATGVWADFEFGPLTGGLGNGGDDIELRDGPQFVSTVIDFVLYDDDPPWPTDCDGGGPSLELINPALDNSLSSSWQASINQPLGVVGGTPAAQNSVFSIAPVVEEELPRRLSAVDTMPTVSVTFSEPVTGVVAGDLTVAGSAATGVTGTGAGPYVFSGYVAPSPGSADITLGSGLIEAGGVPFEGDSWTVSVGLVIVINELHYHPPDPYGDAEFLELFNAGSNTADLSGWTISDGLDLTVSAGLMLAPGEYVVFTRDVAALQAVTGYADAFQWTSGGLSNGGERIALSDAEGNEHDVVDYSDGGSWVDEPDGTGPSLELINPALPNEYGAAWAASVGNHGTPGAQNSVFFAQPAPIIVDTQHTPVIPLPGADVTISALVLDDQPNPTVTLYHRQDADPTVAYTPITMVDDGTGGDLQAGDGVYTATVSPGLADGARLDFTIRADDGTSVSPAPAGHDTDVLNGANTYPSQTYLLKYSGDALFSDFPHYHLITTQRTRNLQDVHDKTEYDATFLQCDAGGACELFYNVVERYRGRSSLNQHPHSFRVNLPSDHPLESEMGFDITRLNLHGQQPARQTLGFRLFRELGGPSSLTQLVRLTTNPLSHGGVQDFVYCNVERVDGDFVDSQNGDIGTIRFPDRCGGSEDLCDTDADCPPGETCAPTDTGNLYRGRYSADLTWEGTNPDTYRSSQYDKETNEEADDWTDLISLCDALTCSASDGGTLCTENPYNGVYPTLIESMIDADQWARWFALHNLVMNTEGGIYRDTGDDYYVYFPPNYTDNATIINWDMDAYFPNYTTETIWRTRVDPVERFVQHPAFAGRFIGSICDALNSFFTPAWMDAAIDDIPDIVFTGNPSSQPMPVGPQGGGPTTRQGMKDWVPARRSNVFGQITMQTTLEGIPASPYTDPNPVIAIYGELNQCYAHHVEVNGTPADTFDVLGATWTHNQILLPGVNTIRVQIMNHNDVEVDFVEDTVIYNPPGSALRLTMPTRMVDDKTLSIRAEMLDQFGNIDWQNWNVLGTVSVRRVSDQSIVPTTVTVFDSHIAVPDDSIRFYNGQGSVSLTLDDPDSVQGQNIEVIVSVNGESSSKVVSVLDNTPGLFRTLSGTLSGADLTWAREDGVIHLTGNCTVPSGSTLDIGAGTLVMLDPGSMNDGVMVSVAGAVSALGTASEPIVFFPTTAAAAMVLTQTTASNANSWRGIHHTGSASSVYEYVFLTGAGNGVVTGHPRPPIFRAIDTHSLTLTDSMMCDGSGMGFNGNGTGTYTISRCLFSRMGIGGEFNGNGHTLVLEDTWYSSTGWAPDPVDGDLIHVDGPASNQLIRRCIFADGGDDGIDHSGSNFRVENSIIWGILDKAVSMTGGSIDVYNTLLFGNGTGIRGGGQIEHVTIANGGPMLNPHNAEKCIIWPSSFGTCDSTVNYTIVGNAGDLGCGTGNFSQDPLFVNPGNRDYNLQPSSPAVNAGPLGERIGWLGFPDGASCVNDLDCDDTNACTLDSCSLGACVFAPIAECVPCQDSSDCDDGDPCTVDTCQGDETCAFTPGNEGANCSDGWACTINDSCSGGTCVGTESCPAGSSCDSEGNCSSAPTIVTFRDDLNGYDDTSDTFIQENAPDANNGALDNWEWDLEDPAPFQNVGLLRFDNIFGSGAGQVPVGSPIISATLTLEAFDPSVAPPGDIYEVVGAWDQLTVTWNNFGGEPGVQGDEVGALVGAAPINSGTAVIDVTSSIETWVDNPSANFGWIFLANANNGLQVYSSEYLAVVSQRPTLTIEYGGGGCVSAADCNDNNPCTTDACVSLLCEHSAIPGCCLTDGECDDADPCTTNTCNTGTNQCELANNSNPCDDSDACTENDVCVAGVCQSGTTLSCDDSNVCTDDTCDTVLGCQYTPNTVGCDDGAGCTDSDTCSGGACVGVDNCPSGTCDLGSGVCVSIATYVFQEGADGYAGTHDSYLQEDVPAAVNGALESLEWDGQDGTSATPNYTILRFDDLFAGFGGPIPVGATISSATLTYTIGGDQSPTGAGGELHMIDPAVVWDEATVSFADFGGDTGVQADEYGAASEIAFGSPLGPIDVDVTAAVQAWSANPSNNAGWIVIPVDNDGVQVRSSEYATEMTERPKLTVEVGSAGSADPPIVSAVGSRYLSVTPPAGHPSVALRVESTDPGLTCLPLYIDATGLLVDTPVFQSSNDWGTVFVGDEQIVPATTYDVRADVRLPAEPENLSDAVSATTWMWADANNDLDVDIFDIVCVLDGFDQIYGQCTLHGDDLRGDVPDRDVDIFDIVSVLDAFDDVPYPSAPCTGRSASPIVAAGESVPVSLVVQPTLARPGDAVSIDVYAERTAVVRGYEIALTIGGAGNQLVMLESLDVETDRQDYIFSGVTSYTTSSLSRERLASASKVNVVDSQTRVYLGTFTYRVSPSAVQGAKLIVTLGDGSVVARSDTVSAALELVTPARLIVAPNTQIPKRAKGRSSVEDKCGEACGSGL